MGRWLLFALLAALPARALDLAYATMKAPEGWTEQDGVLGADAVFLGPLVVGNEQPLLTLTTLARRIPDAKAAVELREMVAVYARGRKSECGIEREESWKLKRGSAHLVEFSETDATGQRLRQTFVLVPDEEKTRLLSFRARETSHARYKAAVLRSLKSFQLKVR